MYSVKQVCDKIGISRSLCYREIHAGRLKAHRFAKRTYRVSEAELARYIEQSNIAPVGDERADGLPRVDEVYSRSLPTQFRHIDVTRLLSSQT